MDVRVHDPAPGSCFLRVDAGAFTVFVATFQPAGTRFHHAHDDLLSYVVYLDGVELLCDPGMPTYGPGDRGYANLDAHNGLHLTASSFAPRPGLFVPNSLAQFRLTRHHDSDGALLLVAEPAVGYSKSLRIALLADNAGLELREEILGTRRGTNAALFHCLADRGARLVTPTMIQVRGARLQYEGADALELTGFARARSYGERLECAALRGSATSRLVTWLRHV
jgi:hypothetical protein